MPKSKPKCEHYPCHTQPEMDCTFCFCPLYPLDDCGGTYTKTDKGLKDCSKCTTVHVEDSGYDFVVNHIDKEFRKGDFNAKN